MNVCVSVIRAERRVTVVIVHDSSSVTAYTEGVRELACEILELMAEGLGVPDTWFFSRLIREVDSDIVLRFNHYPSIILNKDCFKDNHSHTKVIGFGEHSDPQIQRHGWPPNLSSRWRVEPTPQSDMVYFKDTQIWYAIFLTLCGGLVGAFDRLGQVIINFILFLSCHVQREFEIHYLIDFFFCKTEASIETLNLFNQVKKCLNYFCNCTFCLFFFVLVMD
ncbi:Gibberellin 2-beta-dioxygenase 2 [Glycine max]|nr:Gibberellin 2-beta-dioxygenase 2 [Glycine max]